MMQRLFGGAATTALGLGAFAVSSCVYTVEPGHRALIFDRVSGVSQETKGAGLQWLIPIKQFPIMFDVRTTPRSLTSATGTKDLQNVNLTLRMLYKPDVEKLPSIYMDSGRDYADKILPSIGTEVLKAVVARYDADQLLVFRDKVSREIREGLTVRGRQFGIQLEDVSLTHLSFSKDFSKAIENKQVAEQMAERAKFVVAKAEQEKLALITKSSGDAEAAKLVSDALKQTGNGYVELRRIETAKEVADLLCNNPNVTYLPSSQPIMMNMPLGNTVQMQRR